MTTDLKVAIIGCGAVTRLNYVSQLPKVANVKVSYVHDLNEPLAKSVAESLDTRVASPEEIRGMADAVIIATPPSTHKDLVSFYLERVPIVVCEKPFVGRKQDALDLVKQAGKVRRSLFVAHFRRCFPQVQLVRAMIATGVFGGIREMNVYEGGRFAWASESEYVSKDPFGGVLFDTGSHALDMALYSAGLDEGRFRIAVKKVSKDKEEPSHEIRAEFAFTSWRGNGTGVVHFSRRQALANKIKIVLEHGTLEFPVAPSSRVRLTGKKGSTIVFADGLQKELLEYFRIQYVHIFKNEAESMFEAKRFINLSSMLESLANAKAKK